MATSKHSVLFVCLGNICRSPLAEGVFTSLVEKRNLGDRFDIDSCGTGSWHIGEPPHPDTRKIAKKNSISIDHLRARKITANDFKKFNLLVVMDEENLHNVTRLRGANSVRICRLREYDEGSIDLDVPDPYYTGNFKEVYDIVERSCIALLDELEKQL